MFSNAAVTGMDLIHSGAKENGLAVHSQSQKYLKRCMSLFMHLQRRLCEFVSLRIKPRYSQDQTLRTLAEENVVFEAFQSNPRTSAQAIVCYFDTLHTSVKRMLNE